MKTQVFYLKKYFYTKSECDISFIPPLLRRKLSAVDKTALASMNKVFSEDVEEIIFASQFGEIDRLNTIINQYREFDEVSPAQFSGSVHNYPAGFFCLLKKLNIPYYALSAGAETFRNGVIKAVLSKHNNVLFTYAENAVSISCIISKDNQGQRMTLDDITNSAEFIKLLEAGK